MRAGAKLGMMVAAGAMATAGQALAAKPSHPVHPPHPSHPSHPSKSARCTPHQAGYTAHGTLVSWMATPSASGHAYTGTMTVAVSKANHHAADAKGHDVAYTLTNARVRLAKGARPPVAGDRVDVIGKITEVARKCTDQSTAGTITVRKVDITTPKARS